MTTSPEAFDGIAHTALFTAYWRRYGDLPSESNAPHANEIFTAAEDIWRSQGRGTPDFKEDQTYHGLSMEARHLAGNILLEQEGTTQVLDLAAGLSPRGLQQVAARPDMHYVEVDLPVMSTLKRAVLERIGIPPAQALGNTYHLEAGNVLDPATFERAIQHLDESHPVTVFCEGFLHYLDNTERAQVAANVVGVLRRFRGRSAWITDMPHQPDGADKSSAPRFQSLGTGRDVARLAFSDRNKALQFFASQGLHTSEQDTLEYAHPNIIGKLISPGVLSIHMAEVAQKLKPWAMHILRRK